MQVNDKQFMKFNRYFKFFLIILNLQSTQKAWVKKQCQKNYYLTKYVNFTTINHFFTCTTYNID